MGSDEGIHRNIPDVSGISSLLEQVTKRTGFDKMIQKKKKQLRIYVIIGWITLIIAFLGVFYFAYDIYHDRIKKVSSESFSEGFNQAVGQIATYITQSGNIPITTSNEDGIPVVQYVPLNQLCGQVK